MENVFCKWYNTLYKEEREGYMMKKIGFLFSLFFLALILSSCRFFNREEPNTDSSNSSSMSEESKISSSSEENSATSSSQEAASSSSSTAEEPDNIDLAAYFPDTNNQHYIYAGEGNEYASYDEYTDYAKDNRKQIRKNNGGTEEVKVIELEKEHIKTRLSRGEAYPRENWLDQEPGEEEGTEILLKAPLKEGTTWPVMGERTRTITGINVSIDTPMGTYETVEVTTEGSEDKVVDYYAPDIGLVKTVFTSDDYNVTSTLSKIETDVPLVQTVRFYYPNADGETLSYVDKELAFKTNDVTKKKIETAYKELPNDAVGSVLSDNTTILSLYLNTDGRVYVDFSKELISEMNAGSAYETLILQSIVNTIGGYYYMNEVYLTVDGQPYSTGHIQKEKGESFTVDTENSSEAQ